MGQYGVRINKGIQTCMRVRYIVGHLGLDMTTTAYLQDCNVLRGSYGVRTIYNGMNASISKGHSCSDGVGYTKH